MNDNLGIELKKLRKSRRRTQEWIAKKTGVDRHYISKIETGKVSPSLKLVKKIIEAMDAKLLFTITNE